MHNIFRLMFVHYKCYVMVELTFLKEMILIKQVNQDCKIFVTIGIFNIDASRFNQIFPMNVKIY